MQKRIGIPESLHGLFNHANAALISKYISYANSRLPYAELMRAFPEAENLRKLLNRQALLEWRESMRNHNRSIERGERMRLLPTCKKLNHLKFRSLENYMLIMQSEVYIAALHSIASFGERVQKAKDRSQALGVWCIEMPFLITREKWTLMCKRIRSLIRTIRNLDAQDLCPNYARLEAATEKVVSVF